MTDYTLTTEEVRNAFSLMDDDAATQENFHNFDRWLAEVKAQAIYDWVRLVQGKDNFTMDNARSFIDTMRIAEEDD